MSLERKKGIELPSVSRADLEVVMHNPGSEESRAILAKSGIKLDSGCIKAI